MSKGFKLPERTALLRFHGDYEGAEATVRRDVPIGIMLDFMGAVSEGPDDVGPERAVEILGLYGKFAEAALMKWNLLDHKGQPIPATPEGMLKVPPAFGNLLIQQWVEVVVNPPVPLGEQLTNGATSAIPAASPGSSSVPS